LSEQVSEGGRERVFSVVSASSARTPPPPPPSLSPLCCFPVLSPAHLSSPSCTLGGAHPYMHTSTTCVADPLRCHVPSFLLTSTTAPTHTHTHRHPSASSPRMVSPSESRREIICLQYGLPTVDLWLGGHRILLGSILLPLREKRICGRATSRYYRVLPDAAASCQRASLRW